MSTNLRFPWRTPRGKRRHVMGSGGSDGGTSWAAGGPTTVALVTRAAPAPPPPPLLLRELTGLQDPVPELRHAAQTVVQELLESRPERVVVVVGVRPGEAGGVRRFGGAGAPAARLAAEAPDAARDL